MTDAFLGTDDQRKLLDFLIRNQILRMEPLQEIEVEAAVQQALQLLTGKGYLDEKLTFQRQFFEGALRTWVHDLAGPAKFLNSLPSDRQITGFKVTQNGWWYDRSMDLQFHFEFHHSLRTLNISSLTLQGDHPTDRLQIPISKEQDLPHISRLPVIPIFNKRMPLSLKGLKKRKNGPSGPGTGHGLT